MSLDGAVIEELTGGINSPAAGQQGYFAIADQQEPYPNLEYVSPAQAAILIGASSGGMPELTISNTTSAVLSFADHSRKRYTGSTTVSVTASLTGAKDGKIATLLFPIGSIATITVSSSIDPTNSAALVVDSTLDAYQFIAQYFDGGCIVWSFQKVIDV